MIIIYALSAYKDPLRSLIMTKHHKDETAIRLLANLMTEMLLVKNIDFDIITYIPLHWTRYAQRGFNQAAIIAQAISAATGRPIIECLKRSKKTEFQAQLSVMQRQKNLEQAFSFHEKYANQISHKKILIIDDLFTTGSTIKAAAKTLSIYKPEQIIVFVACRVIAH